MTDKQIIIDGCDVSGCSSFDKKTGHCLTGFRTDEEPFCNCFTCYYKQLKRKEQECGKYKKALEDIEVICVEQNLKYDTIACEILDVIEKMYEEIIDERI